MLPSSVLLPIFLLPIVLPVIAAAVSHTIITIIESIAMSFWNKSTQRKNEIKMYVPPVKKIFFLSVSCSRNMSPNILSYSLPNPGLLLLIMSISTDSTLKIKSIMSKKFLSRK